MTEIQADLIFEEVAITFRGKKTVYTMTEMTGGDREKYIAAQKKEDADPEEVSSLFVKSMRDVNGHPPLIDDVQAWGTRTHAALSKIFERLNGVSQDGQEAAKKD